MSFVAAASTYVEAADAANQVLHTGSNASGPATAVDAVIAGVFALAARHPGVLLGHGALLLGGRGEGLILVDGRAVQPGREAPRPRGYLATEPIPEQARMAVPIFPYALVLAHAGRGTRTFLQLANQGIASAKEHEAKDAERTSAVKDFAREGASWLKNLGQTLLRRAPRSLGGLYSQEDFLSASSALVEPLQVVVGERAWALPPWSQGIVHALHEQGHVEEFTPLLQDKSQQSRDSWAIVAAADGHGAVALACVYVPFSFVSIADSGLQMPLLARPVLRGEPRISPGTRIPMPSLMALSRPLQARDMAHAPAFDLGIGIGGANAIEGALTNIIRACAKSNSANTPLRTSALDQAITSPRSYMRRGVVIEEREPSSHFGIASGVLVQGADSRPLLDTRKA